MNTATKNTAKKRTVSVIVPAFNEAELIGETLKAINEATKGRHEHFEVVVVNDSSTDETKAIAESAGAKVVDVELRNIGAVRNAGAKFASGEYLIFVDADTIIPPETLAATVEALNAGALGGGASVSLESVPIPWYKYWLFPLMKTIWQSMGGWAAGCYMYCRAEVFEQIDGFPEEYFAAEELFFSRKIKALGKFVLLPESVITSSRKFHDYSIWSLLGFVAVPLLSGPTGAFKSQRGLEILYRHREESAENT